jgi:hypothetical protein
VPFIRYIVFMTNVLVVQRVFGPCQPLDTFVVVARGDSDRDVRVVRVGGRGGGGGRRDAIVELLLSHRRRIIRWRPVVVYS